LASRLRKAGTATLPLTRRQVFGGTAASAAVLSMPAIVTRSLANVTELAAAPLRSGEMLPEPDFSVLRPTDPYVVGIRPFREGGVCLKLDDEPIASRHGSKFLIHNYGHGGAGITLSFGCASVVADHVRSVMGDMRPSRTRASVAVIGSGVIGLT